MEIADNLGVTFHRTVFTNTGLLNGFIFSFSISLVRAVD